MTARARTVSIWVLTMMMKAQSLVFMVELGSTGETPRLLARRVREPQNG
jgi:hypothetical protein